jgi:hypothetical protein
VSDEAPAVLGIAALAGWWRRLLGGSVEVDDDGATLHTPGGLAIGATRADDVYDGGRWQVLRDPEGNEFCLLRPRT